MEERGLGTRLDRKRCLKWFVVMGCKGDTPPHLTSHPRYFACSSIASIITSAIMHSATGTILGAIQGSCLPPTEISRSLPVVSTVR